MNNAAAIETNYEHELELAEAEQAWHDYAQARLARSSASSSRPPALASRAAVPAMHQRELEAAAREAAAVIKIIRSDRA